MYADSCFEIYIDLSNKRMDEETLKKMNLAPGFFQVTIKALFSQVIIVLGKIYENSKSRNLINLMNIGKEHRDNFEFCPEEVSLENIRKLENELEEKEKIVSNLFKWRNKVHAHYDKKYFLNSDDLYKDAPLKVEDIRKLLKFGEKVINTFMVSHSNESTIISATNRLDIDNILNRIEL